MGDPRSRNHRISGAYGWRQSAWRQRPCSQVRVCRDPPCAESGFPKIQSRIPVLNAVCHFGSCPFKPDFYEAWQDPRVIVTLAHVKFCAPAIIRRSTNSLLLLFIRWSTVMSCKSASCRTVRIVLVHEQVLGVLQPIRARCQV